MGEGFFGIDRPGTVGNSGWFGAPRPLVGAANGIKATVTTTSAAQVAVANSTPDSLQNLRDELNMLNREIDNKQAKLERIKEMGGVMDFAIFEDIPFDVADRRIGNLMDEVDTLERERDMVVDKLDKKRMALDEGDLRNDEIKDGIQEPVMNTLNSMGISKGPFIDVSASQTEILFSMVNVREEDISETRNRLEELGFQVGNVEGVEMDKLFS
jgi:hypothetical protein